MTQAKLLAVVALFQCHILHQMKPKHVGNAGMAGVHTLGLDSFNHVSVGSSSRVNKAPQMIDCEVLEVFLIETVVQFLTVIHKSEAGSNVFLFEQNNCCQLLVGIVSEKDLGTQTTARIPTLVIPHL